MRTAELKKKILLMFRGREFYGYEVNKLLSFQEESINISRLYSVLNEMQKEGLLNDRWEKSSTGPRKKMYSLTDKGKEHLEEFLLEAISTVHLFYGDYLRELYPKVNVFGKILDLLTNDMKSSDTVAYLSYTFSGMHQMLIGRINQIIQDGKMYLVTPEPSERNIDIENLNVLDGAYDNLPFKTDYLNRLVVIGVPKQGQLKETIQEWHRVVTEEGRLVIVTPTILIQKQNDPISIGDFVEKYEHQIIERVEPLDPDIFCSLLKEKFTQVEEVETVHMSFITAYN